MVFTKLRCTNIYRKTVDKSQSSKPYLHKHKLGLLLTTQSRKFHDKSLQIKRHFLCDISITIKTDHPENQSITIRTQFYTSTICTPPAIILYFIRVYKRNVNGSNTPPTTKGYETFLCVPIKRVRAPIIKVPWQVDAPNHPPPLTDSQAVPPRGAGLRRW